MRAENDVPRRLLAGPRHTARFCPDRREGKHVYKTIVVGTDGSNTAKVAVAQAADLAALTGARLHIVTAVPTMPAAVAPEMIQGIPSSWIEQNLEAARQVLDETAAEIADRGVEVSTEVGNGDPADCLLRACESADADLLVVGNRGMQGARRFLLGSVANRCAHHAGCSVLIVSTT
jgi:nucleotide-binding universal stress UspA family protein